VAGDLKEVARGEPDSRIEVVSFEHSFHFGKTRVRIPKANRLSFNTFGNPLEYILASKLPSSNPSKVGAPTFPRLRHKHRKTKHEEEQAHPGVVCSRMQSIFELGFVGEGGGEEEGSTGHG
jgi:hypothetical protein